MQRPPLDQPLNLQVHARVHEGMEMLVRVFQRQGVGVGEVGGDEEVEFGREIHQGDFLVRACGLMGGGRRVH